MLSWGGGGPASKDTELGVKRMPFVESWIQGIKRLSLACPAVIGRHAGVLGSYPITCSIGDASTCMLSSVYLNSL